MKYKVFQIRTKIVTIKIIESKIWIIIHWNFMSNNNSSYQFTSSISTSLKREALWNIIEPGDPYDIRK